MGKNNFKKQNRIKREEEKANRLFKYICITLIVLAILMTIIYSLA